MPLNNLSRRSCRATIIFNGMGTAPGRGRVRRALRRDGEPGVPPGSEVYMPGSPSPEGRGAVLTGVASFPESLRWSCGTKGRGGSHRGTYAVHPRADRRRVRRRHRQHGRGRGRCCASMVSGAAESCTGVGHASRTGSSAFLWQWRTPMRPGAARRRRDARGARCREQERGGTGIGRRSNVARPRQACRPGGGAGCRPRLSGARLTLPAVGTARLGCSPVAPITAGIPISDSRPLLLEADGGARWPATSPSICRVRAAGPRGACAGGRRRWLETHAFISRSNSSAPCPTSAWRPCRRHSRAAGVARGPGALRRSWPRPGREVGARL
jgi:hypothetical protein